MDELSAQPLIVYPRSPRPSYADHVLSLFHELATKPESIIEVSGLQTALGLVAAGIGLCLVPESVQQLRRGDVIYRELEDERVVSPVIMSCRMHDESREVAGMLGSIRELYKEEEPR